MSDKSARAKYETVIGLEVHVELSTTSKLFCGCRAKFGGEPNTRICPVCTGMPGTLPVLNKKAVIYAVAAGLAFNCKINEDCVFDRKNYFYPDNPQGYQISQLYSPLCTDGYADIEADGASKRIGIREIHLENDAGKLIHDEAKDISYVDYNRSGVPLIEIVSQPDMRSADEAVLFMEHIRTTALYMGISDCRMQEGSIRADVNVSVRKYGEKELGARTEMKNLNSFGAVKRAIENESARQITLIEGGNPIKRETRHWDDIKRISYPIRSKEEMQDYRYFPEPDIPAIHIGAEMVDETRAMLVEPRDAKKKRYISEFALSEYDANIITASKRIADIFEECVKEGAVPKKAANWLTGETLRLAREKHCDEEKINFSVKNLCRLISLIDDRLISSASAKIIFEKIFEDDIEPEKYAREHDMLIISDSEAIREYALEAIKENPKAVDEYRQGKEKALMFLLGCIMRKSNGRVDPKAAEKILQICIKYLN